MKILWINPSFLDYRVPLYSELNKLAKNNFYLIYSIDRVPERIVQKIDLALDDNAIGLNNEIILSIGKTGDFANQGLLVPFQKGLLKTINSLKPDIIISEGFFQWTPYAVLYSLLKRKPLWISYERTAHTERNCPKWRTVYRKFINLFVNGYLANGKLTEDYLISLGSKKKRILKGCMSADSEGLSKKIKIIHNDEILNFKKKFQTKPGIIFLFIGQIIERKGLIYLLNVWNDFHDQYPNSTLIIVGEGPQKKMLAEKFKHNDSIFFEGEIDYDRIYYYYSIADVFILPTLEDNWSLVIPEAMACGLPVATSLYNGCYPELVKQNINGYVFDPLNTTSVYKVLEYFIKNTNNLKKMGAESIKIEQFYTADKVAKRIIETLLNNN